MIPSSIRALSLLPLFMMSAFMGAPFSFASDFHSPRTAGLGGAGHAAPLLTDAIYLNPSYVSFLPAYVLGMNYGFYKGGDVQSDGSRPVHGHVTNLAIQDGRTEMFQAGVGATIKEDGKLINVGASKTIIETLGVGIGSKFIFPNNGNGSNANDWILSTTFMAAPWFQVVGIVDNLFESDNARAQGLYREYILGTKFNVSDLLLIYFDPHLAPGVPGKGSFGQETGVELTAFKDLLVRLGMFRNSAIPELRKTRGNGYGFGLGWIGPKLSLDYGIKRTLEPIAMTTHNFGFAVYF